MSDIRFSEVLLEQIKGAVPISEVVSQHVVWDKEKSVPSRQDYWACCPFHGEKSPSFHAEDAKGMYHCFGCGVSGDHYRFLTEQVGMSFVEAVEAVAEMAGIPLPDRQREPGHANDAGRREVQRPANAAPRTEQKPAEREPKPKGKWTLVDVEPYTDRDGNLIYEVCRIQWKLPDQSWELGSKGKPKKSFVQRRPSGKGDGSNVWGLSAGEYMRRGSGKDWKLFNETEFAEWATGERGLHLEAVEHTVFHHSQVEIAIAEGRTILLPEGERKVHVSEKLGYAGSCNSGGAKNWKPHLAEIFRGADVVIPVDNDETGREAGEAKAVSLRGIASRIRVLDFADFVADFPAKHDIVDWHAAGGTAEQLQQIIDQLPDWKPPVPASRMGAVGLHELHLPHLKHEFLIDDFLDRQGVAMMPGASGSGKTFLILEMAMCVALNREFWGMKVKPGLVLYQAGEGKQGVTKRLDGWMIDRGVSPSGDVPFKMLAKRVNLFNDDKDTDDIIEEGRAWSDYYGVPVRMVVIDTFNKAITGANENAGQDMTKVLARLERISTSLDCLVVVPIHKSAEGKMRGHTSLTGDVSNVINVTELEIRDRNSRVVRTVMLDKNKDGEKGRPLRFVLRQVVLDVGQDGKAITTCVVDRPDGDEQEAAKQGRLSLDQSLVFRALKDALDEHGEAAPHGITAGPQIKRVVSYKHWEDRVRRTWAFTAPEDEPEARGSELKRLMIRAGKVLSLSGYLDRDNDKKIVWWTGKEDRPPRRPPVPEKVPPLPEGVREEINNMDLPF